MFDGPTVVQAFRDAGITHVVWVPDSDLGRWEAALAASDSPRLVRVCREGEAFAVAAGLLLGGARPIVLMQCTGLFEAGDALRNVIHDLGLPIFVVVGVRSWKQFQQGRSSDNCPRFTEPIVRAWDLPYTWLEERHGPADLAAEYKKAWLAGRAGVVLYPE